ncbi:MAG: glucodextranase DOMON-like domain-containing protein, partial [Gaiellaceae bacterium]
MNRQGRIVALILVALALPGVASAHRPGPDILYELPAQAPQLENTGPWQAPPILVSGATAYRGGEFLYQDYLYDDHGAAGVPDLNNPVGAKAFLFSPPAGTFTYPTNPVYANNAADLVEFRVRPLADATAFRVTLNTLKDPDRTAFTIALGSSAAPVPWPHGA